MTETIVSNNLIDQSAIADGTTVVYSNGELTGVSSAFKSLYPVANPFPLSLEDQTTQYTLSFEAYTDAEQGTNGNGIYVAFLYSDGTQNGKYVKNAVNTYTHYEVVSSADLTKHIVGVFFNYGTIAQNTFHIKNMMLNKGKSAQPYELQGSYSAKDIFARSAISEVQSSVDAQIGIQGIKIDDIRSAGISNFFDQSTIAKGEGITFDGVELKGTANAFRTAFPASGYIPITLPDYSTRYTLSFEAYTDGNVGTDSNGLKIYYLYDDDSADTKSLPNSTDEYTLFTFSTSTISTKHLIGIYFGLGSIGENVWHVKNMMLNKGTTEQAYAPYYTANDEVARSNISRIDSVESALKEVSNIIEHTPKASGTQYLNYPMKAGTTYAITSTGGVTLVLRDADGTELENTGTLYRDRVNYFTPSYDSVICSYWTSLTTGTMRIEEVGTIEYDTRQNTKDVFYLKSGVPSYFESMISSAASEIREKMNAAGRDGDSFIFITDIHWPSNQKNSPYLCRYIMEHTNVPFIICGGDILTQTTRSSAISQITETVQAFTFKNKFFAVAFGNHDSNWNGVGDQHDHPERYLDISDEYALFGKQCDGKVTWLTTTEMSFYFDNVTTKTRYFVLDTGDDGNTGTGNRIFSAKNELATALSEVQSGWHIIFAMHIVTYGQIDSWISPLLDAYNARTTFDGHDFTNAVGEVVLIIGGHTHKDENKSTTGGIPIIVTACDAASQSKVEGIKGVDVSGTTNEQCFDTVVVNYSDRVIDCIRVGYGQSRQFTY